MFGIGPQEMMVIGLLFLIIFGPSKLPSMARDLGRFVNEARSSLDEFRSEFVDDEDASDEDEDDHFFDEDETREQGEKEELALREEARATQAHAQTKQQP